MEKTIPSLTACKTRKNRMIFNTGSGAQPIAQNFEKGGGDHKGKRIDTFMDGHDVLRGDHYFKI